MAKSCPVKLFSFFIVILLLISACTSTPDGNPADGERWFRMNRCNGCHGENGVGGKGIGEQGPTIAGLQLSYREFISKLRAPDSAIMPPFEKEILPDKDAADIYLWLKQQSR